MVSMSSDMDYCDKIEHLNNRLFQLYIRHTTSINNPQPVPDTRLIARFFWLIGKFLPPRLRTNQYRTRTAAQRVSPISDDMLELKQHRTSAGPLLPFRVWRAKRGRRLGGIQQTQTTQSSRINQISLNIARLEGDKASAWKLHELTTDLTAQMRRLPGAWRRAVDQVESSRYEALHMNTPLPSTEKEKDDVEKVFFERKAFENTTHRQEAEQLLQNASTLISLMLKPPIEQTAEDKEKLDEVNELMQEAWKWDAYECCQNELVSLADYLDELAERITAE